jgi:hypothetical protein
VIRVNLAVPAIDACPSCGAEAMQGFDGGRDALFEYCERERTLLRGPQLRAWCDEHAKHCTGCDGRDGPTTWACDFFRSPPRWLVAGLRRAA